MELNDFIHEFHQSIEDQLARVGGLAEAVFVERFCSFMGDGGAAENVEPAYLWRPAQGIKINAYSYSEAEGRLALYVAIHCTPYGTVATLHHDSVRQAAQEAATFFRLAVTNRLNAFIDDSQEEVRGLADLIASQAGKISQLDICVISNGLYNSDGPISVEIPEVDQVYIGVWDVARLYGILGEVHGDDSFTIDCIKDLGETLEMMRVPGISPVFDCYVGYIPGVVLARAYARFGARLIERNVRSFLQAKGKVNKGIKETLQCSREMFVAYNNGISTTADGIVVEQVSPIGNLFHVRSFTNWQVVNGGQTTASLFHAYADGIDLNGVAVQVKLTVLKAPEQADDLAAKIALFANTQNKIALSDLKANDDLLVQLEKVSREVWTPAGDDGYQRPTKWYFERARGQYLVELSRQKGAVRATFLQQYPKEQVINKTDFAKYYMAWERMPHLVGKGSEANFRYFVEYLAQRRPQDFRTFYQEGVARAIVYSACTDLVLQKSLPGYRANVVAYTVAILSETASADFSLKSIWRKQGLTQEQLALMNSAIDLTWEHLSNPPSKGTNISQWCKQESCWAGLKEFWTTRSGQRAAMTSAPHRVELDTENIIEALQNLGLRFVDARPKGGSIWVIGGRTLRPTLNELARVGWSAEFIARGSRASKWEPAWELREKKT
jgi:hypothetical protein